ncbi:hypothetical protein ACFLX7_01750 [Chloroflexota bacterium]
MKLIYSYLLLALAILLFLGSLGAFVWAGTSGVGVLIFVEATRHVSTVGKLALALLGAGTVFFLIVFIFAKDSE